MLGKPQQLLGGFALGVLVAAGYAGLAVLLPPDDAFKAGPLARMGMTSGVPQLIWISVALLFAPIIEECLFRGVMYGGYRRSLGPAWAALLSTLLFWVLHLTETFGYWPGMMAILMLALIALLQRLRCSAIGPAVAVHLGYNTVVVIGAVIATAAAR